MDEKRKQLIRLLESYARCSEEKDLAVIGMSGRYPRSGDLNEFWENLRNGENCIGEIPPQRWDWRLYKHESYSRWGGFLADVDAFDPLFFHISPREAEAMDPQERLFLEVCWAVFEDAGYSPEVATKTDHEIGVFVGVMNCNYEWLSGAAAVKGVETGARSAYWSIANRVSYVLDLQGPSMAVDTACSSSLTALHLACQSLKRGECRMAVCGGVNVILSPAHFRRLCQIDMIAPDDRCKSFGEGADGFVDGEGVGAVLLKPLPDAVQDNDRILGIIKGTAVNAGGKTSGYSVPNPNAQARVIADALKNSRVNPRTISYVEAHGTGTALGDPIEILGLGKAYGSYTDDKQFCAVGSLKSNMGHMESAAGVAGLIKVLLQMKHGQLVPSLHSRRLNPKIDFASSPFYVQRELEDWNSSHTHPRRAAISSFGAGGANAHAIVEEYIPQHPQKPVPERAVYPIPLSARTSGQLLDVVKRLKNFLLGHGASYSIRSIAYTLQTGRRHLAERLVFWASGVEELVDRLADYVANPQAVPDGDDELVRRWLLGESIDWSSYHDGFIPEKVSLPTYPFEKKRFPLPNVTSGPVRQNKGPRTEAMRFVPGWIEVELLEPQPVAENVLVLGANTGIADYLKDLLNSRTSGSGDVVVATFGDQYLKHSSHDYCVRSREEKDYQILLRDLKKDGLLPEFIVTHPPEISGAASAVDAVLNDGIAPVFHLLKEQLNGKFTPSRRFLFVHPENGVQGLFETVGAFSRSLKLTLPELDFVTLQYGGAAGNSSVFAAAAQCLWNPPAVEIMEFKVAEDRLYSRSMVPVNFDSQQQKTLRSGGTYLVTGGCGGLGWLVSRYLAEHYNANLVLVGRSPKDKDKEKKIREIQNLGGTAVYVSADVSSLEGAHGVVATARESFGSLNGVIHSAGVIDDTVFYQKDWLDFSATLAPKVAGTVALDLATKQEDLDVFIVFSSASSVLGDIGQCDYALGNRFMDCFMDYRDTLREDKQRSGLSIAIDWPVWRHGGMHLDESGESLLLTAMGLEYLEDSDGLAELETVITGGRSRVLVLRGDRDRIYRHFGLESRPELDPVHTAGRTGIISPSGPGAAEKIRGIAASVIRLEPGMFDDKENFGNYGFDSITLKEFANALQDELHIDISPTIFFQYSSLETLSGYLVSRFPNAFAGGPEPEPSEEPAGKTVARNCKEDDIAIIGAAGKLPGSKSLDQFWSHLESGRDLITDIPAERWDWRRQGEGIPHWGGFVPDVDAFDARFFNISPREAELMDPQQRLLCQIVWQAFEDSGYSPEDFSGHRIGVFIGAESDDYVQLLRDSLPLNAQMIIGNHHAVLANRISFLLNFKGVSESINTACSSSLVAVHQAAASLRAGESELAVAGGVSLMLSPQSMKAVAMLGVLSADGRCKTFDRKANGYVRGEGVGAVLLKPLRRAQADGDHIYAIVKSSAVNHGGKANSFTAPNSGAQAALLMEAYRNAGIHPEEVSYIEVHGTGTELGDPVEIDAVKQAFEQLAAQSGRGITNKHYCGLGTAKTYIGHLEPASGIAGLLKVILSMKHRTLPGNLHFQEVNPLIDVTDSPFYIVEQTKKWEPLTVNGGGAPRIAGVSAFGFGGTNAHVVLQEYIPEPKPVSTAKALDDQLVVLSAKNKERLQAYAASLREYLIVDNHAGTGENEEQLLKLASRILNLEPDHLDSSEDFYEMGFDGVLLAAYADEIRNSFGLEINPSHLADISTIKQLAGFVSAGKKRLESGPIARDDISLAQIAFTLQMGRSAFPQRLAIVARDTDDLLEQLLLYLENDCSRSTMFSGRAKSGGGAIESNVSLEAMASAWVKGAAIDWNRLHEGANPGRVPLPTYPFAMERHWFEAGETADETARLHPLLGSNTSTFLQQRFSTQFSGEEFFIHQHRVLGVGVLPGVAYLEMARAAGELAAERTVRRIRNIVWMRPLVFEGLRPTAHLVMTPQGPDQAEFSIVSHIEGGEEQAHARGILSFNESGRRPDSLDIKQIENRCTEARDSALCYCSFLEEGLAYGPAFQGLKRLCFNRSEVLAQLELPDAARNGAGDFALHPSILDAALQAVSGLTTPDRGENSSSPRLPFTLGSIELFAPLTDNCYAYVTPAGSGDNESIDVFNIIVADPEGNVCLELRDFTLKAMSGHLSKAKKEVDQTLFFQWEWAEETIDYQSALTALDNNRPVWLMFATSELKGDLIAVLQQSGSKAPVVIIDAADEFQRHVDGRWTIDPAKPEHYQKMTAESEDTNSLPSLILFCGIEQSFSPQFEDLDSQLNGTFFPLLHLAKALASLDGAVPTHVFHIYSAIPDSSHPLAESLPALFRTIWREHSHKVFRNVGIHAAGTPDRERWSEIVELLLREPAHGQLAFDIMLETADKSPVKRLNRVLKECSADMTSSGQERTVLDRKDSVYVITGGAGGLALSLAEYLGKNFGLSLVLADIAPLTPELSDEIEILCANGSEIRYVCADLSQREDVKRLLAECKRDGAAVGGIFHCAGIARDSLLAEKTDDEARLVFGPKLFGTMALDQEFKEEELDVFALFSSTSVLGNAGQADYAFANHFLDHFAAWREQERAKGNRHGKTISINWPLWKDGGMRVDAGTLEMLEKTMGVKPLPTGLGIDILVDGLKGERSNFLVLHGQRDKLMRSVSFKASSTETVSPSDHGSLLEMIQRDCCRMAAKILKIAAEELEPDGNLHEWGFDSINLTEFANTINTTFGLEITPAIFFESGESTVANLASSLFSKYPDHLTNYYSLQPAPETSLNHSNVAVRTPLTMTRESVDRNGVAIIGMSGVLPMSGSLDEFWDHIVAGHDLITEVPVYRWDWQSLYPDKPHAARGGFLQDVRRFDAEFFGISPREAMLMEPQQRIFLQTVWKTIEDAGYSSDAIGGTDTAVFVGVSASEYNKIYPKDPAKPDPFESTGIANSILVNRISYLLDIHGPSEAIDTACSSSLVAIHRAVGAIRSGRCPMAIAGGVNVLLTPDVFLTFDAAGMLSKDGHCKTFDDKADGYVRAEGAGAVLLKPLWRALEDNDHVYAAIIGSAVNHGGRSHSLTAPNADSQAELLTAAYEAAAVSPDTIGYIEAHGTGTKLGDPVEVEGLKKAFGRLYKKFGVTEPAEPHTGIGSVKSNTGHLETAAGMAGLFKVVLAMNRGIIPGTIHFKSLNSHIRLDRTPFYIVDRNRPWQAGSDGASRRAGISSFGFGGANAHIVLEHLAVETDPLPEIEHENVLVLSAKTNERLLDYAGLLLAYLKQDQRELRFRDVCFTLQTGRKPMEARLAIVASSLDDCRSQLERFLNDERGGDSILTGFCEKSKTMVEEAAKPADAAKIWVRGGSVDWNEFYRGNPPRRLSLPTYPFSNEIFWPFGSEGVPMKRAAHQSLHVLVDKNASNFNEIAFTKVFSGREFFIADHGDTLPAVAYIEMARAAAQTAMPSSAAAHFRNITISRPITFTGEPREVRVVFHKQPGDQWLEFQVTAEDTSHAVGYLQCGDTPEAHRTGAGRLDLDAIMARCEGGEEEAQRYYRHINANDGKIGPRFMGMLEFFCNGNEALAGIGIIPEQLNRRDQFLLHPVLTDAAIQTMVALGYTRGFSPENLYLPYVIGSLDILDADRKPAMVYVSCEGKAGARPEELRFSAQLATRDGDVVIRMSGCLFRPFKQTAADVLYYRPYWEEASSTPVAVPMDSGAPVLLFDIGTGAFAYMSSWCRPLLVQPGERFEEKAPDQFTVRPQSPTDIEELLTVLKERGLLPSLCVFMWMREHFDPAPETLEEQLSRSVIPLLNILKAHSAIAGGAGFRILTFGAGSSETINPVFGALSGFLRSVSREIPRVQWRQIVLPGPRLELGDDQLERLKEECLDDDSFGIEVVYRDGHRMVRRLRETPAGGNGDERRSVSVKKNGVYIISGGMGGLGAIFARHLAGGSAVNLALADLGPVTAEREALLSELRASGSRVMFIETDVTRRDSVTHLIHSTKEAFGSINGVIHCAGVVRDALLRDKSLEQLREVVDPKMIGALRLDLETADEPLDFFVMFSSLTAWTGNYGQSDYGYANGFLDSFAVFREEMVATGERNGKTLSINWPLWQEGGMTVKPEAVEEIFNRTGIKPLNAQTGVAAFDWGLNSPWPNVGVLEGARRRMAEAVNISIGSRDILKKKEEKFMDGKQEFEKKLLDIVADLMKIEREKIRVDKDLSTYGFDSISFTELAQRLNRAFGFQVTPDLFFEHGTLGSIAGHLFADYAPPERQESVQTFTPAPAAPPLTAPEGAVAIVGMSGSFPQSEDLEHFWNNVVTGRRLITKVPSDRWDWRDYGEAAGTGGFMIHADKFDPLFFNIAPSEAELMDPQIRLFLQTAWHAVENAGYSATELRGADIGVFAGVSTFDYQKMTELIDRTGTEQLHFMVANRVSYFMDWHGPSEAIDTACSSSLVAVHRAVESLRAGECSMALAGGVNLLADPNLFVIQANSGMLSPDGTCYTFDKRANGYVRGEGVGAILLKPLANAIQEGDCIYAVIRGSGVNHGGHANSFSTPNPTAQSDLLASVYLDAGIDPDSIGYIEAHGTGTKLGDPLEINALKKAFDRVYKHWDKTPPAEPHIVVGTVKTRIGHLESAAGIAGLIFAVLSINKRTIPGNANFKELNPYIKLDGTPFKVAGVSSAWQRFSGGDGVVVPRRAGVSSFGIGGTNAHVILEEYRGETEQPDHAGKPPETGDALFVFSARNHDRLMAYIKTFEEFLTNAGGNFGPGRTLTDLAFTLQTGREAMAERLAILAASAEELLDKLSAFQRGESPVAGVYTGNAKKQAERMLLDGEEGEAYLGSLLEKGKLDKIARLWTDGADLDWRLLYNGRPMKRVSLPVYPFAQKRFWISPPAASIAPVANKKESFYFTPRWEEISALGSRADVGFDPASDVLMVFGSDGESLKDALAGSLKGCKIGELSLEALDKKQALADSVSEGSILYFLGGIREDKTVDGVEDFDTTQEAGVVALFRLIKQLCAEGLSVRPLTLKIVTNDGCAGLGRSFNPYCASLHGLAAVVAAEFPRWSVACVDISLDEFDGPNRNRVIDGLSREPGDAGAAVIALRDGVRYKRVLETTTFDPVATGLLQERGTYLVIGGTGRIGMDVAGYLASNYHANLVLTGRSPLSETQAEKVALLESMGASVLYIQADVTDWDAMRRCVATANETFGRLNGVFHSAMAIANQALENMDEGAFKLGMAPKVNGAFVLERVLGDEDLDFILFFSSAQSFIREAGMANYVAGNVFEDAWAEFLNEGRNYPVRVINWGYWQREEDLLNEAVKRSMERIGLVPFTAAEGLQAIETALASSAPQIVALKGTKDFLAKIGVIPASEARVYQDGNPSIIRQALAEEGRPLLPETQWRELEEGYIEVEETARDLLLRAFQRQGVFIAAGERYSRSQLEARFSIIPEYTRLFDELLDILGRGGFLESDGSDVISTTRISAPAVIGRLKNLDSRKTALIRHYPDVKAYVELLWICLNRYFEILGGEVPATDILFPGSSMELMEGLYKGNSQADYFNELLVWSINSYIRHRLQTLPSGGKITILEVGAGTGGTTGKILETISRYKDNLRYIYTDISQAFTQFGQKRFGADYPFVEFAVLNIEKELESQGFAYGECDLVIGANVVHATVDINDTVARLKQLLKPNGWLVMNEGTAMFDYGTMMFGLLEGWWLYKDEENRNHNCPLLRAATWRRILHGQGFRRVALLGHSPDDEWKGKQHIIIGESDGRVRMIQSVSVASEHAAAEPEPVVIREDESSSRDGDWVEGKITEVLQAVIKLDAEDIDPDAPYSDFGVDSILAIDIVDRINQELGIELRSTDLFNYASVNKLTQYIVEAFPGARPVAVKQAVQAERIPTATVSATPSPHIDRQEEIAIIGMSGRFPGASDVDQLWRNLVAGVDSVTEATRWDIESFFDPDPKAPNKSYCKWGGFLDEIDRFDSLFFNISPTEAEMMDPQQRMFLEEAYNALVDAAYADRDLEGIKCGTFVGFNGSDYSRLLDTNGISPNPYRMTGNYEAMLSARISYFLNLRGPSITVNTACSSSLVAFHLACESLRCKTSDMAIAGGASVMTTPGTYILLSKTEVLSFSGQSRAFDNGADGVVLAEGAAAVVLKPLEAARRDGDHIYAVVCASGLNQDGRSNGITAPSATSQTELLTSVYRDYAIDPELISYIETHGTGTRLGDPIEIDALTDAFAKFTDKRQFCAVGSVKTNIGHSTAAAGVTGLIKVLLCMKHKRLVPSLHFDTPNQFIDFEKTPFFVNTHLVDWKTSGGLPRMAAVSSFGFSGTNAHVVLREETDMERRSRQVERKPYYMLPISARTGYSLDCLVKALSDWVRENQSVYSLADISYSLLKGRSHHSLRHVLVLRDINEAVSQLKTLADGGTPRSLLSSDLSGVRFKPDPALEREGESLLKELGDKTLNQETFREKLMRLAHLYCQGYSLPWERLYQNGRPKRLPLPTYPFDRQSYWPESPAMMPQTGTVPINAALHPLLDSNESTLQETLFKKTLDERSRFGALASLEMAVAAISKAGGGSGIGRLTDCVWGEPPRVNGSGRLDIYLGLYPCNDFVGYELFSNLGNGERYVHSQGKYVDRRPDLQDRDNNAARMSKEAVMLRCDDPIGSEEFYRSFQDRTGGFGVEAEIVTEFRRGDGECLCRLDIQEKINTPATSFMLAPLVLEGILQVLSYLTGPVNSGLEEGLRSIGTVEWYGPLPSACHLFIREKEPVSGEEPAIKVFDVQLADTEWNIVMKMMDVRMEGAFSGVDVTGDEPQDNYDLDLQVKDVFARLRDGEIDSAEADLIIRRLYGQAVSG